MKLFDVYPLFNITPVKAEGCYVWDSEENKYLDLYGGHAVISIGHSHPNYVEKISTQLSQIGFYSNSIQNPLQQELAEKLGEVSGCSDYQLFLCNSGAEANENAIKLASFVTGKKKFISYKKGFHGRTSAAVALTDNPKIIAPVNETENAIILPFNDIEATENILKKGDVAAIIVEGIQGIGGINIPEKYFLTDLKKLTEKYKTLLILDEIQSGYGRSGRFFAFQYSNVQPDLITVAKGMGNGFPIGGVLIQPEIEPWFGMLGTTFGGNHLACAAGIAVLDVIQQESLVENSEKVGNYLMKKLAEISSDYEIRGKGLMIGIESKFPIKELRQKLLFEYGIFTGVSGQNIIRLLPPLNLTIEQADQFLNAFSKAFADVSARLIEQ
ncbi:MAG: aspartate aminotransferase family protein [Prolixibacteraceae bacterium]|jgi:acetylornithine/N-succinyldiaminopimelate aminotransferase|nr:aspartate aminotransferase family protein [Prolixibacteraceae bacterium]MBT6764156.1 aspartate aminotransferase family protein [Prolixibacteraceae bacterium]MBT6998617.1 aspartate aminotransferase family protein [Prolixibacteraceae bacterium]MBT7397418.1 aspartate aminotransferase family protein [Prolixibacteraceae bacterium]